jgi:integrase/recombinase XerD
VTAQLEGVLRHCFRRHTAIRRHLDAPLVRERVAYLQFQLERGVRPKSVGDTAALLLHVVRLLAMETPRYISRSELKQAGNIWAQETPKYGSPLANGNSARRFVTAGRGWLRFHGLYNVPDFPPGEFSSVYADFIHTLKSKMGYRQSTITGAVSVINRFLSWSAQKRTAISLISLYDIDTYLEEGRNSGWRLRTICCQCQVLRTFFHYAESRGLCKSGFADAIQNPRVKQLDMRVSGPCWRQIRRLIDQINDSTPAGCRAKMVLLLCSIYGLRNTEVTHLRLEDFDWQRETFTVRRVKGGKPQLFPIQYEVGEAIIQYLKTVRPRSTCRNLLVTLVPPFRPLINIAPIVQKELKAAGIVSQSYGSHSLRHACATELLRKGTSLRKIADYLGHRDIRSVSVYAKFDLHSLRKVVDFSLAAFV